MSANLFDSWPDLEHDGVALRSRRIPERDKGSSVFVMSEPPYTGAEYDDPPDSKD